MNIGVLDIVWAVLVVGLLFLHTKYSSKKRIAEAQKTLEVAQAQEALVDKLMELGNILVQAGKIRTKP